MRDIDVPDARSDPAEAKAFPCAERRAEPRGRAPHEAGAPRRYGAGGRERGCAETEVRGVASRSRRESP